ncbi:N-acetylglucosamine-6-phosphate deacetylase [Microbacterium sediminis]|uniref:N-acetylglucosamine-6-phosphate deacetylase n=1 Tax=Microbacterium sediminis TaxID=904291 RepID=A0A1B9N7X6_9MICO|nr:N-acetylglucosamine-6-phosphate deacetylase [Microbacterium sediminis]OCG72697.1 N-acetylglucosamine-6-phosphate deacetylase [Microbacterium sediminis]QBR74790.1 N-acetylglucosamine-6-phosphate deacetylase [Microbacterium sediminis]
MGILIHSARLVTDRAETADAWIRLDGDRVAAVGTGAPPAPRPGDEVVDAREVAGPGATLTPGFIDIHGHGGGGAAFDDGADAIRTARALHRAHGTTRAVVSLVTAPIDRLAERVAVVAELAATDPGILGSHLEGPFLDPGHNGAHDPALLRDPTPADLGRLLEAGRGTVRQVTIAPERPGGIDAVRLVVGTGAAAAIGHTDADAETALAAINAGATILTHAFNAMRPIHHRDPGPIPVAARDERVTLELIADGVHVRDEVMRMLFASAPGRVALVTDAMAAAGMADGAYVLGALDVDVTGGVARVRDSGAIAGSTLTQDAALRRAVAFGAPLADAVDALTAVPARAVGRADLGSLREGAAADAVLLDADLRVRAVWAAGARA